MLRVTIRFVYYPTKCQPITLFITAINPRDPQWWLAGSVHPYAPFVGNALKWESYVYDDGTTYVCSSIYHALSLPFNLCILHPPHLTPSPILLQQTGTKAS